MAGQVRKQHRCSKGLLVSISNLGWHHHYSITTERKQHCTICKQCACGCKKASLKRAYRTPEGLQADIPGLAYRLCQIRNAAKLISAVTQVLEKVGH